MNYMYISEEESDPNVSSLCTIYNNVEGSKWDHTYISKIGQAGQRVALKVIVLGSVGLPTNEFSIYMVADITGRMELTLYGQKHSKYQRCDILFLHHVAAKIHNERIKLSLHFNGEATMIGRFQLEFSEDIDLGNPNIFTSFNPNSIKDESKIIKNAAKKSDEPINNDIIMKEPKEESKKPFKPKNKNKGKDGGRGRERRRGKSWNSKRSREEKDNNGF